MASISGNKPHVLAIAVPGQGHVKSLMSLCRQIARHGIKVTFVNAQSVHERIVSSGGGDEEEDNVVLASLPDDNLNDPFMSSETLRRTMPQTLPDLVKRINGSNPRERISCMIIDLLFGWVFDLAKEMGVEAVSFSPFSVASCVVCARIPELIQQGFLDAKGSLEKIGAIKLSDQIPSWRKDEFPWSIPMNLQHQKRLFQSFQAAKIVKWSLSNTCYELEPAASELHPDFLPVGPLHLMEESRSGLSNFYPEDGSCLTWLDTKPPESVVYVSFGSLAIHSKEQLNELALGLEMSGRAFLWVIRRNLANGSRALLPDGFLERVSELGKIVEWAPQNEVLSHPAIACFISHCGWNSTLEGVSTGVPYLCWPYFCEQTHNESYICDEWEIGLRVVCDENGIRSRHEIKKKIDMLLSDKKLKENVMKLKESCAKSISEGGSSYKNLEKFIDHLRKGADLMHG